METTVILLLCSVLSVVRCFECPKSNARGLFPNKQDCSKYYQCVGGGKYYAKNCPPGLLFDSRYSICNWPGYVSCYVKKPQIQPLASEEEDPVLSGKIGRYPQQLGRNIHTTIKQPTFRTKSTTTTARTTTEAQPPTTTWLDEYDNELNQEPQVEKYTTLLDGSTVDPSPGPITTPQSVLEWLYEDQDPVNDKSFEDLQNVHPEAPPKEKVEASLVNSVAAAMDEYGASDDEYGASDDEYGGFDDDYEDAFEPPPECSAAFSLELDSTRCEGFYQCYLWIPYPKVCPAGLLFDHRSNVCNWPEYVYCLNGERYDPPETTTPDASKTSPQTPPVPSNNFDLQSNYADNSDDEISYDDYWPIEGIQEGERQTAFKKNIDVVESSQIEKQRQSKENETTANQSETKPTEPGCKSGKCNTETIKTSKYKVLDTNSDAKTTKKSSERYTVSSESNSGSNSSSEESSNGSSSSKLDSSSEELKENNSSFASSEEEQTGAESDSFEETNDIINIQLSSDRFKLKENNIQVEIIAVKEDHHKKKSPKVSDKGRSTAPSSTTLQDKGTTRMTTETSSIVNIEELDDGYNGKSVEQEVNSTELPEGSGSLVILSKIDTLRNSVEKLLTETDVPATNMSAEINSTTGIDLGVSTKNTTEGYENSTILTVTERPENISVNGSSITPTDSNVFSTVNQTNDNTTTSTPLKADNETKSNNTESDKPLKESKTNTSESLKSGSAAYHGNFSTDKPLNETQNVKAKELNSTTSLPSEQKAVTENGTDIQELNVTFSNVSTTNSSFDNESNETESYFYATSTSTNVTIGSETKQTTTSAKPLVTVSCLNSSCNNTDFNETKIETKTNSVLKISPASSKAMLKPKSSNSDTVMLHGKSPIARILEKLLNIRMKQIGKNKFKAVSDPQKTVTKTSSPSENKLSTRQTSTSPSSIKSELTTPIGTSTAKTTLRPTVPMSVNDTLNQTTTLVGENSTTSVEVITDNGSENSTLEAESKTNTSLNTDALNVTSDGQYPSVSTVKVNESTQYSNETTLNSTTVIPTVATVSGNSTEESTNVSTTSTTSTTEGPTAFNTTNSTVSQSNVTGPFNESSQFNETTDPSVNVSMTDITTVEAPKVTNVSQTDRINITIGETYDLLISNNTSDIINSTAEGPEETVNGTANATSTTEIPSTSLEPNSTTESNLNITQESNITLSVEDITDNVTNSTSTFNETKSNVSSSTKTTAETSSKMSKSTSKPKSSKITRKQRETNRQSEEASRFRLHVRAPHFEARKVFGGPDDKWRFSDGTLADPFSRQERDLNIDSLESSAVNCVPYISLILVLILHYLA